MIKHPQHILAFDKKAFGVDGLEGFVRMGAKPFFESAARSLVLGRRQELETDERFAQVLPYIVLYNGGATSGDPINVFTYQRTKAVGEKRLAGNISVGTGGHVDLGDIAQRDSVIDFVFTLAAAIKRELNEEVEFVKAGVHTLSYSELYQGHSAAPQFCGLIADNSNAVGRVHYGCVMAMRVPEGYAPRCIESELTTIGMVSPHESLARGEGALENWSKIVLENIDLIAV